MEMLNPCPNPTGAVLTHKSAAINSLLHQPKFEMIPFTATGLFLSLKKTMMPVLTSPAPTNNARQKWFRFREWRSKCCAALPPFSGLQSFTAAPLFHARKYSFKFQTLFAMRLFQVSAGTRCSSPTWIRRNF